MVTQRLRISGRVQGVGYREALRFEAQRLGVTRWVRKPPDRAAAPRLRSWRTCASKISRGTRNAIPASSAAQRCRARLAVAARATCEAVVAAANAAVQQSAGVLFQEEN